MAEILPAVLFGYGNPMNAQMDNSYTRGWRRKRSTGRKAVRKSSRRYDTSLLLPWSTPARRRSNLRAPSTPVTPRRTKLKYLSAWYLLGAMDIARSLAISFRSATMKAPAKIGLHNGQHEPQ